MALAIGRSVGDGGSNQPVDVQNVRKALNAIPERRGGPLTSHQLPPNASIQLITNAIAAFQGASVSPPFVAGRVDPAGTTFTAIDRLSEAPRDTALRLAPVAQTLVRMALQAITQAEGNLAAPGNTVGSVTMDALATHFH